MERNILLELESAAKVVLAPPSIITPAQRQVAEKVFLDFRKTEYPYGLCKYIFETCTVDYILFETASCLITSVAREWDRLPVAEVRELHKYLVNYLLSKPSLPPFVRERIILVIVIVVKRASVIHRSAEEGHESPVDLQQFLSEVEELVMKGEFHKQLLGCSIISTLLQEFSLSSKSSGVNLFLEHHNGTKRSFQANHLKRIFEMSISALNELIKIPTPFPENAITLMKHLLTISEAVLEWDFTPNFARLYRRTSLRFIGTVDHVPLKRDVGWSDVLLNDDVINLYFNVYWKMRDNPTLSHHALNCLAQFASLQGPIVSSKEGKSKYFSNYIQTFLNLLSSIQVLDREAQGIALIVNNLFAYCPKMVMTKLNPDLITNFLERCTSLTCYFAEGAAHEESLQSDDCMFMEAFETMLKIWLEITNDVQSYSENFCQRASMEIFNTYLKCHLSPPHGTRGTGRELDSEEITDSEEDDGTKFRSQLQCIGRLGRLVSGHSLPLLARFIEERTTTLHSNLQRIHQNSFSIADSSLLASIFEDLHWLILIAGHVIAMESPGEAILIPSEILNHSLQQQASVEVSLNVLAGSQSIDSSVAESDKCDDIVRLVSVIFKLSEVERKVVEAKLNHLLSPEVSKTLLWFLKHWSVPYLLIAEDSYSGYSEVSVALLSAFGRDTEGAQWAVNFLFRKIESSLKEFNTEPGVVEGAIDLMVSMLDVRTKALAVLKSEGFWRILEIHRQMDMRTLPAAAKIGLMRGFISGGAGLAEKRDEYWQQILTPMLDKFRGIIFDANFRKNCQNEDVRAEILFILESYAGVALGVHVVTIESLFLYIAPVLEESSNLISIYCNYQVIVDAILDLFLKCAQSFLCYLSAGESKRFYLACLNMVQMYAKSNRGRRTIDANAEDQAYNDIVLLMELFSSLLSKEFFDLRPLDPSDSDASNVFASDVCMYGLKVIIPLMNVELLKCSSLGVRYYRMISSSSNLHPEKILALEPDVLQNVLSSVELGLQTFGQEEAVSCCCFVRHLTNHILTTGQQAIYRHLVPFLKLLLDMTMYCQINVNVLPSVGEALLPLIVCYKEDYENLVRGWVSTQADPVLAQRLQAAFNDLTSKFAETSGGLIDDIRTRRRFRESFEKFTADLHGFLWVL